jgi:hypothetical protein
VRRTLDYYACRVFNSRQGRQGSISAWAGRIDALQAEFKSVSTWSVCQEEELAIMSARDKGSSGYSSVPKRNKVENVTCPPVRRNDRESRRGFPGSRDRSGRLVPTVINY